VPLLRVAFVITELDPGGAERCLANLATSLDRSRFAPVVYCLAPPPRRDDLVRQLQAAAVPVQFLGARSAWQFPAIRARLRRLLEQQSPHIVQAFLFHANVLATLAANRMSGTRLLLGLRVADPARWRSRLETWIARRADRVVCVSHDIAETLRARSVPAHKTVVIPNGIDLARFDKRATPATDPLVCSAGRQVLVTIGRLHPQKGLDWYLSLCPDLLLALPDHDVVLVGEGPQRPHLQQLVTRLNLQTRVHFVGRREDVPNILARSQLLVLPSRWEGMPNVVLEAMAARRAVVCTEVSGVKELLGDAAPEQTARFGATAEFRERILRIAKDATFAAALGRQNRERVESNFVFPAMVRRYEDLFESL
jgi:glycosyltransferase involved in cell wall biosynthesis